MTAVKDMKGKKFGRLTPVEFAYMKDTHAYWKCICDCGNEKIIMGSSLRNKSTFSCGCYKKVKNNLIGKKFHMVSVINQVKTDNKNSRWNCLCDCGKEFTTSRPSLIQGHTLSCGCYGIQQKKDYFTKHGMTESKTYKTWEWMKTRCLNFKSKYYHNYGGRGIKICDRWVNSFENFFEDMGEAKEGMSIERIDNEKGYSKENCKWIPKSEQARNKRNTAYTLINNQKIKIIDLWKYSDKNCSYQTFFKRLKGRSYDTI